MAARHVNAMCDTPALLHTNKKRLSGSSCPDGAFGVRADAERAHFLEVCENLSIQQCSVAIDLESVSATSRSCVLVIANPFGCAILSATDRILPSGIARRIRADAKQSGPEACASKDVT